MSNKIQDMANPPPKSDVVSKNLSWSDVKGAVTKAADTVYHTVTRTAPTPPPPAPMSRPVAPVSMSVPQKTISATPTLSVPVKPTDTKYGSLQSFGAGNLYQQQIIASQKVSAPVSLEPPKVDFSKMMSVTPKTISASPTLSTQVKPQSLEPQKVDFNAITGGRVQPSGPYVQATTKPLPGAPLPAGAILDIRTNTIVMPGEYSGGSAYTRGTGAIQEDRTWQTLASEYSLQGLGDPRGLNTTQLSQGLNKATGAGYKNVTAGQIVQSMRPISYTEFKATGGAAPVGKGIYPERNFTQYMSRPGTTQEVAGKTYTNAPLPETKISSEAKPSPWGMSVPTFLGGVEKAQPTTTKSSWWEDYKSRVSGPMVPSAYAQGLEPTPIVKVGDKFMQGNVEIPASQLPRGFKASTTYTPWVSPIIGIPGLKPMTWETKIETPEQKAARVEKAKGMQMVGYEKAIAGGGEKLETVLGGGKIGRGARIAYDFTIGGLGSASLVVRKSAVGGWGATTTGEKLGAAVDIASVIPVGAVFGKGAKAVAIGAKLIKGEKVLKGAKEVAALAKLEKEYEAAKGLAKIVPTGRNVAKAEIAEKVFAKEAGKYGEKVLVKAEQKALKAEEKSLKGTDVLSFKLSKAKEAILAPAAKVARVLNAPVKFTTTTIEKIPGISKVVAGTGKTATITKGTIYLGTLGVQAEAVNAKIGRIISNPEINNSLKQKDLTMNDIIYAGNRAESGAIGQRQGIGAGDISLGGLGKSLANIGQTAVYWTGAYGKKDAFEQGVRDILTEKGITGSEADKIVNQAKYARNLSKVAQVVQVVQAENVGNVVGGKSMMSSLSKMTPQQLETLAVKGRQEIVKNMVKKGYLLAKERPFQAKLTQKLAGALGALEAPAAAKTATQFAKTFVGGKATRESISLLPLAQRAKWGFKTRMAGGAGEAFAGTYSTMTNMPTQKQGLFISTREVKPDEKPVSKGVISDVTGFILSPKVTLSGKEYSMGKITQSAWLMPFGAASAGTFGAGEEAIRGLGPKVPLSRGIETTGRRKLGEVVASTAGNILDIPEAPGDWWTKATGGPKGTPRISTFSFQAAQAQAKQQAKVQAQAKGFTQAQTRASEQARVSQVTQSRMESFLQQQQKVTVPEKIGTTERTTTGTTERTTERITIPERTTEQLQERVFTPPPLPILPLIGGNFREQPGFGQAGGFGKKPLAYQRSLRARILGLKGPSIEKEIYSGQEERL